MEVVYEKQWDDYLDQRILLSSPAEAMITDRLQRLGEPFSSIRLTDEGYLFTFPGGELLAPAENPLHVWRTTPVKKKD